MGSRFSSGPADFHNILALRLEGDLDIAQVEDALTRVADRHPILRSTFLDDGTRLVQRVMPSTPIRTAVSDAPEHADGATWKTEAFEAFLLRLGEQPFESSAAPPWRVHVVRLDVRDHVLVVVFHHIVIDGISSAVFLNDLAAFFNGEGAALPPLPVQYTDYAVTDRARHEQIARDIEEWRRHLAGCARSLALPGPAAAGHRVPSRRTRRRFLIDAMLASTVEQAVRQSNGSLFGALAAALAVSLSRIGGDLDLALSIVKSTRRRPELERIIGPLVDTMLLRVDLPASPTFAGLVQQVRDRLQWGFARPVPHFALVRALGDTPPGGQGGGEVAINYHKTSTEPPALGGLRASLWRLAGGYAAYAMVLEVYNDHGALECLLDYDATRLSPSTIERVIDGLEAFLRAAGSAPHASIETLPTVTAAVAAGRLLDQPRGANTGAVHDTVLSLFAHQVRANPSHVAIRDHQGDWSLGAVDERSSRLANLLRARGVQPGSRVGICLHRSADLVIAALAVMKAGAAYVPIDPEYPTERIRLMVEIAEPSCIIGAAASTGSLPSGIAPLLLDREAEHLLAQPAAAPAPSITADSPAYVLFTSGSTGRPRGVVGLHRGIVNRIAWMRRTYPFRHDEVCAQKTSAGFVDSVWEIFGPLTSGVPLVVLSDETVRDTRALVAALAQHRITRVVLVPSLLEGLLDAPVDLETSLPRLRLCACSGEPLPPALATRCRVRLPHVTLLNIYGSSEVAADVTWSEVTHDSIREVVSVGRPIDNVHIHLLDRARQPVPRGEEGEIYIGGAALAAGYMGDERATGERFIADPFAVSPGARLFKTGDLGRVRDDGELEVIGRLDQQVKLLGRRLEPAEIEGALVAHPSIRQAAVVLNRDRNLLAAFVVPRSTDGLDRTALTEFLRQRLPAFMVPTAIVAVHALPLSPHGKIDRAQLALLSLGGAPLPAAGASPQTPLEQQVAGLFTEVLGVSPRSADDDFIALGGHSLRATRLAWRIHERLGVDLPPGAVFAHPTVRQLAAEIARHRVGQPNDWPPILPVERRAAMPLSAVQRRFWFEERLQDRRGFNHHGGAYRVTGPLDVAAFDRSLTTLVVRHEALRTLTVAAGDDVMLEIRPAAIHVSPLEDLTRVPEADREGRLDERLQAERRRPFVLDSEFPFRVRIYRLASDRHVISFSFHHSAFDGWSAAILMRELSVLYGAECRGANPSLAALPIQYADFAAWQRACSDGAMFAAQRDYWRRQLGGVTADLELPLDRHPRPGLPPRMGRVPVALDSALMGRLRALGQREGATTFMTLSAGYATLLARYSGQWDVVIGTAVANRRLPQTQSVIGAFVNTLALRFPLDPGSQFQDAVRLARAVATAAFDHQDLPFDVVVADAAPQRSAERTPLFQALFTMQDRDGWQLDLDGLMATEIDTPPGVSAIPLSLVLHERGSGVQGHFEYRADLFDVDTIVRLGANYLSLLNDAAGGRRATLQQLRIISDRELAQLRQFEGSVAAERAWERLEQTFARHAGQTPDAPAVATLGAEYSYRDLDHRAQQIATRLIAMGVATGQIVAIEVSRSVSLFVAILGVLRAGAAYVVVDPQQPDARRRFILDDSGAVALISGPAGLEAEDGLRLSSLSPQLAEPANDGLSPLALACLIYTSGSSGRPKGVRITHRNIAAMSDAWGGMQGITAASRAAQMVSPAFDVALGDIFATWSRGACLCPIDPAASLPGRALVSAMARLGVTHWTTPPSLLAECPATPWPELEVIAIGGEPAAPDVLARWSQARIVNAYGLTEGTVASTAEVFAPGRPSAIGSPLQGVQLRIVDADGTPVPIGTPGQIVIAGPQVAEGYHRRPDLSSQHFTSESDGPRLLTGDRGRWRADGRIEFLGRLDRQMKFHGYRIEPGEIEAAARSHAAVEQAFVAVRKQDGGDRLIAYVVARPGETVSASVLREHLRARVPLTMCPTDIVLVEAFPRTATGKIDALALPPPDRHANTSVPAVAGDAEAIITAVWRDVLGHSQFGREQSFFDAGGHSLLAARAHDRLAAHFGEAISVVDVFAHPTIAALARHLEGRATRPARLVPSPAPDGDRRIAIIGMACRYPKSPSVDDLWRNLLAGVECLTRFTPEALAAVGPDAAVAHSDPRFVPVAGIVDDIDRFDAEFFGLSVAEASLLDPQQRLLLELAQTALDTAGYDARRYPGRIGVFAGVGFNGYLREVLYPNGLPPTAEGFAAISANDKDFAASQVAYRLDLRGPAVTVQTACSTSLVAVDIAIQAILSGRCDMALAGGVSLRVPQPAGYRHEDGMILSPDGHCRPFDAKAAGTVGSGGGGVVLLKRLDAAIADGDQVEAVILGSASNNDGRRKVGFTAPGVDGQTQVIREALAQAGVDPATIQYVEAHGTGTSLGDPIEIQALNDTYGRAGETRLGIGSIKSNLGHADTAAGVAGLIKAALALKHNRIPPTLHFTAPNPRIDFGTRLFVADRELPFATSPRRAAVSAFGLGGTNAHVILEQPPLTPAAQSAATQAPRLLPVSARSVTALREACANLADTLGHTQASLDAIAFTLQRGRGEHAYRHVVVAAGHEDARSAFAASSRGAGAWPAAGHGRSAWLFSGQGSQAPGMARALYESQPVARESIDRCSEAARPHLGLDLRGMLCGDGADIHETRYAQPALFTLQYALARTWQSFGVTPSALIGHSVGEFAAACLAGVFGLEEAIQLVCERGRLMHQCPPGAMLSVRITEATLRSMLDDAAIDIAAINAPESCVVAGTSEAIARFRDRLAAAGHASRLLVTERAFHSRHMAEAEEAFEQAVHQVNRAAPAIPMVSTLTGAWLTNADAMDPARWRRQLREPVRFFDALRTLESRDAFALLELGPDHTLSALASQIITDGDRCVTSSLPSLETAVGRLWAAGCDLDWKGIGPHDGRRVALPTYPFQRSSHWGRPGVTPTTAPRRRPIDEWFAIPAWYRSPLPPRHAPVPGTWLIVTNAQDRHAALAQALEKRGAAVTTARPGAESAAHIRSARPSHVVVVAPSHEPELQRALDHGLHDLLDVVRVLGEQSGDVTLVLITEDVLDVTGTEALDPSQATAIGALKVVPYEYPHIRCRHIDVSAGAAASALVDELGSLTGDQSVALRGGHRWLAAWPAVAVSETKTIFRDAGTYLITGGFGGVGLTIAQYLGETLRASVALVGRNGAPADPRWASARSAIERAGGTVHAYAADVGDGGAMRAVIEDLRRRCGAIHGCIHAAGVIDRGGIIHRRDRASVEAAIRAKVHGAVNLLDLLAGEPIDFLVLCSTLGTMLPQAKFGQVGYAAANEYLDAFAGAARRRGVPAVTINWADWSDVGMSVTAAAEAAAQGRPHSSARTITPAEGIEVLGRLAATAHSRVVMSPQPLEEVRREIADLFAGQAVAPPTRLVDPGAALNRLWSDALGVPDLSPDSDFFTLGGHSLMAIQILTRVRELFDVTLPLAGFLDQPTLGRQTIALERALAGQAIAAVTATPADTDDEWTL